MTRPIKDTATNRVEELAAYSEVLGKIESAKTSIAFARNYLSDPRDVALARKSEKAARRLCNRLRNRLETISGKIACGSAS